MSLRHRTTRAASRFASEALEPRLLLATISGVVFDDRDADGVRDSVEPGSAGWTVYVDGNNNNALDVTELRAVTAAGGAYSISGDAIRTGTLHLRQVPQAGWRPTAPAAGEHVLLVGRLGDVFTDIDFGNTRRALVTGTVFSDANDDGAWDRGEAGQPGRTVFADADGDGLLDSGESSDVTDDDGDYALSPAAGAYVIRQVQQSGWWQTHPSPAGSGHAVTLAAAQSASGRDFGNVAATYDLLGVGFAITSAFAPAPADGRLDVFFQLRNTGTADSPGFRVAFYLSEDDTVTTADRFLRSITNGSVPRHSTQDRTTTINLPDPDPFLRDNQYWVGMIIDELNDVAETNEANNANQGLLADRHPVSSEGHLPIPADGSAVRPTVLMVGSSVTGALGDEWIGAYDQDVYQFRVNAGHGVALAVSEFAGEAAVRVYDASMRPVDREELVRGAVGSGTYYAVVSAAGNDLNDPGRLVGRTPGQTGSYRFSVIGGLPDLVGTSLSVSTPPGTARAEFTVADLRRNFRGAIEVSLYISDDPTISTSDVFAGTVTVASPVTTETEWSWHGSADLPVFPPFDPIVTDNQYWVGMIVDPADRFAETDESNNSNRGPGLSDRALLSSEEDLPSPANGGVRATPLGLTGTPRADNLGGDEWIGPYDQDVFLLEADADERLGIDVDRVGGNIDSYLRLYDAFWTLVAANDNGAAPGEAAGVQAYLEYTTPADGRYYAVVSGRGNHANDPWRLTGRTPAATGEYTLAATRYPAGPVSGTVFEDSDGNGVRDAGEAGLPGWTVFLDRDLDGGPEPSERRAVTDASGEFVITGARAGSDYLRTATPDGWLVTAPDLDLHPVALQSDRPAGPFVFGAVRPAAVSGSAFEDTDGDGTRDAGESPLAGQIVYSDLNRNGMRDVTSVTLAAGDVPRPGLPQAISRLPVPGHQWGSIDDVDVLVDSTSLLLRMTLAHVGGARVELVTLGGGVGIRFPVVFDDEAGAAGAADEPADPPRRAPSELLSAFDRTAPTGLWELRADYLAGSLGGWSLLLAVSEPFAVTDAAGNYTLSRLPPGDHHVRLDPGSPADRTPTAPAGGSHAVSLAPAGTADGLEFGARLHRIQVVGRHLFYNNSAFDARDPAPGPADDAAVAPDKRAYAPPDRTAAPTSANITGYTRGINGLMIDVDDFRGPLAVTDFAFMVPDPADPTKWLVAPSPSGFAVRALDVAGSPHRRRVTFTWPEGQIRNTWLQVTVLANANTRRLAPDVFYFGNLVGEAGDPAGDRGPSVTSRDLLAARRGLYSRGAAAVDHPADFNRDRRVDARDLVIVRQNFGRRLAPPQLAAAVPTMAAAVAPLGVAPAPAPAPAPEPASRATSILAEEGRPA